MAAAFEGTSKERKRALKTGPAAGAEVGREQGPLPMHSWAWEPVLPSCVRCHLSFLSTEPVCGWGGGRHISPPHTHHKQWWVGWNSCTDGTVMLGTLFQAKQRLNPTPESFANLFGHIAKQNRRNPIHFPMTIQKGARPSRDIRCSRLKGGDVERAHLFSVVCGTSQRPFRGLPICSAVARHRFRSLGSPYRFRVCSTSEVWCAEETLWC